MAAFKLEKCEDLEEGKVGQLRPMDDMRRKMGTIYEELMNWNVSLHDYSSNCVSQALLDSAWPHHSKKYALHLEVFGLSVLIMSYVNVINVAPELHSL